VSNREANYEAVHRILSMIRILERNPMRSMTVATLANRLGVSEKTVDRYAKALSDTYEPRLGGPLLTSEGKGFARAIRLTHELLDHEERSVFRFATVRAATRVLTRGTGSVLGDSSEGALEVLRDALSPRSRTLVERAERAICYVPFGPKDLRVAEDIVDELLSAAIYQRVVEVTRRTRRGEVVRERLESFSLVLYRDGLYLLARRAGDEGSALRTYAIERFDEVHVDRESSYEIPDDFDPDSHFAGRLGIWEPTDEPAKIELSFTEGAAAVLAPRIWPGKSSWRDAGDGRRVLELELPVTPELVSWIVSWGSQVEVLGPSELREEVIAELTLSLQLYAVPSCPC